LVHVGNVGKLTYRHNTKELLYNISLTNPQS